MLSDVWLHSLTSASSGSKWSSIWNTLSISTFPNPHRHSLNVGKGGEEEGRGGGWEGRRGGEEGRGGGGEGRVVVIKREEVEVDEEMYQNTD